MRVQDTPARESHPAMGLATFAAAGFGIAAVLVAIPGLFNKLLTTPSFGSLPMPLILSLFTLLTFGLIALIAFAGTRISHVRVPFGPRPGVVAGAGFGLGVLGFTLSLALCVIAGTAHEGMPAAAGVGLFLLETVLTVIQSGAEEYAFRGWLQTDLQKRWGKWPALAAASLLFGGLHFVVAATEPLTLVTMLLGGVLFGLVYMKSGSLLMSWALHFGWNWTEEMIFGLAPENPGAGPFGALINIDTSGSAWWGGTPEALNASLSSIIILVALVAATAAWPSRATESAQPLRKIPARG